MDALSKERKGTMGVASLVLGIVSIVFSFTGAIAWVGIISGIIGIILGAMARKTTPTGIATGGLVCSIIGLVISLIGLLRVWLA